MLGMTAVQVTKDRDVDDEVVKLRELVRLQGDTIQKLVREKTDLRRRLEIVTDNITLARH